MLLPRMRLLYFFQYFKSISCLAFYAYLFFTNVTNFRKIIRYNFFIFLRFGCWAIMLISILLILIFLVSRRLIIFFKKNVDLLFLNFLLFGKKVPISPNFLDPKKNLLRHELQDPHQNDLLYPLNRVYVFPLSIIYNFFPIYEYHSQFRMNFF